MNYVTQNRNELAVLRAIAADTLSEAVAHGRAAIASYHGYTMTAFIDQVTPNLRRVEFAVFSRGRQLERESGVFNG